MTNDEHDLVRVTLRLSQEVYAILQKKAKQREQSVSTYVRGHLIEWLQSPHRDKASKAKTQAISEMLYLLRAIANGFEPELLKKAHMHARLAVEKLYSRDEEVTSCD